MTTKVASSDRARRIKILQQTTSIMAKSEQGSDKYIVANAVYQVTFNHLRNNTEMNAADLLRSSTTGEK